MKRVLFLISATFILLSFSQKAQAVTLEAQSDRSSNIQTFVILANPPAESTAVQLRLDIEGGTVTSFSAGEDGLLSIGTCDNDTSKYTSSTVCVDVATAVGTLSKADVLGVLTVEKVDQYSQLRITKAENNSYIGPRGVVATDSGVAFTLFGGDLVNNQTKDSSSNGVFLLIIMVTFLMGVVIGTTFTTLGHVLQAGRVEAKKKK